MLEFLGKITAHFDSVVDVEEIVEVEEMDLLFRFEDADEL
jgi:hypothetical protein